VHLTETCESARPNLITDVQTTPANVTDVAMTDVIHGALAEKGLLPNEHLVDAGYVDAGLLVTSHTQFGVDLYGPAPPDTSWQARTEGGLNLACFAIDWQAETVTCPEGQVSQHWRPGKDRRGCDVIVARFDRHACQACARCSQCVRSKASGRVLTFRTQAQHTALQKARERQKTPEFKERYKRRAGIEGTISQGTRSFELRKARYIGLPKTHLQHVFIAAAINVTRAVSWLMENPKAKTRHSRFAAIALAA
jgi:transposase